MTQLYHISDTARMLGMTYWDLWSKVRNGDLPKGQNRLGKTCLYTLTEIEALRALLKKPETENV